MPRAVRKYGRRTKVVHFALQTRSTVSYCSFTSRVHTPDGSIAAADDHTIDLDHRALPPDTPITCIACLAEAGFDVP